MIFKSGKEHHQWTGYGEITGQNWARLKQDARTRNIDFNLTIKEAWELYLRQNGKCALSGIPLYFNENIKMDRSASLDRIDSKKCYSVDNCQWLHKTVNMMKQSMSDKEFIEWCRLVSNNFPGEIIIPKTIRFASVPVLSLRRPRQAE